MPVHTTHFMLIYWFLIDHLMIEGLKYEPALTGHIICDILRHCASVGATAI